MPELPEGSAPGEYIKLELEVRSLTQVEFAKILGRPVQFVSELLSGKRSVTPETAVGLASALEGTAPRDWLNREAAYQLSKIRHQRDFAVEKRAKLFRAGVPVKELVDRRWIEDSIDGEVLFARLLAFYDIPTLDGLDEPVKFGHASRQSTSYAEPLTPAQRAWLCRSRKLAQQLKITGAFTKSSLDTAVLRLTALKADVESLREVASTLSDAGVRFLVVQPLAHTKIDGVCFWLDDESPVIVLSLRYDRVDWFWHTLFHEIYHVESGDGRGSSTWVLDTELVGTNAAPFNDKPENEKRADERAVGFLVDQRSLDEFIRRVRPYYSAAKIAELAARLKVHPGIIVGQLQYRREIPYSHSRRMLVGVKESVTATAMTDGWGWVPHL